MRLVRSNDRHEPVTAGEAKEAEAYARMMDEILLDIDDLEPDTCPPDRRFLLADKEAWIYEHGNICELVYVRTDREA